MKKKYRNELNDIRTDLLYANSFQSILPLLVIVIFATLWFRNILIQYNVYDHVLFIWLPFAVFSLLLKTVTIITYNRLKVKNKKFWRIIFLVTTAITGAVFGSYIYFLHYIDNQTYILFFILLLGALSSGSVSAHSTSMTAFIIYNSLTIFPYSIYFILSFKNGYEPVGFLILLFIVTISITAYRVNRTITKSLALSLENESIIEKLRQSEEKFSKSFYSGIAPMAMLRIEDAKFIDVNNAMVDLVKLSRDEIIDKNPYEINLYNNTEDAIQIIIEASSGHVANREISLRTGDNKTRNCLVNIENFILDDSAIALIMLHDFTERIEHEKELEYERDRAETAAIAKTKFLASMSHEIRTPMNSIIGMTNLAIMTENKEERNEYLNVVKDSGNYLLVLINDILDMTKIEAGKVEIDLIDTDLKALVKSVHRSMELLVKSKKLSFTVSIIPDVPLYIKSAPERLRQILINLIGNAIKFTNTGGIDLTITVSDGKNYDHNSDAEQFIEFSVSDTGIGIPADKHKIIFESFTQADPSTFRKYGGTGLGLAICKQITRLMHGDIRVVSEEEKGSTFCFIIPLIHGEKPPAEDITQPANHDQIIYTKILIAEDNIMNQKLIEAYMKKLGRIYSLAENGIDVIEKLKSEKFDIILMDLEMPVMNGFEAMKRIRSGEAGSGNADIAIFAMSAHVLHETIDKCIDEGFNGYIIKPVDLKKIREIL